MASTRAWASIDLSNDSSLKHQNPTAILQILEKVHDEKPVFLYNWKEVFEREAEPDSGTEPASGQKLFDSASVKSVACQTALDDAGIQLASGQKSFGNPQLESTGETSTGSPTVEPASGQRPKRKLQFRLEDVKEYFRLYLRKIRGAKQKPPKRDSILDILLCFLASFTSIATLGAMDFYLLKNTQFTMMIPAFGAMAVILFTDVGSRGWMAQPRNAFFGHVSSAVIGLIIKRVINWEPIWVQGPLAVSITIALMSVTHTVHPAAGATALTCIYAGDELSASGWWFILVPVASGSIWMLFITLVLNNLSPARKYPSYWY